MKVDRTHASSDARPTDLFHPNLSQRNVNFYLVNLPIARLSIQFMVIQQYGASIRSCTTVNETTKQLGTPPSVAVLAEISLTSPQKVVVFF